ncbi:MULTISPECIES: V-type ATP synthase subunit D [unclassified Oceanispirochaeta]|uniref:V-type ATP synthase subunit D n=1 Tax=unclassified Oceanispirochaeta TaxID=2635722 RepID=UPI000E095E7A|nr:MULTISPECIES: V-type ATP synthase subunit D [unclassified Oceanispirochaeta]MBF9015047.1 V-type ATP synthase subunit D [Oceanispirochaeta sp. M2]NPD71505.1 V-type ATP synthase subunit D [Oceanispirochaeta sp. M1]RDG33080.1 V-type ATP synthase subunit D [Oceanispirochaeta sp. M1]
MAKIKLTKNEQKKQKDELKMYSRYLPTLILKKQQLQIEIRNVEIREAEVRQKQEALNTDFRKWIGVFGEDVGLDGTLIKVKYVNTASGNIAGVEIPVFEGAEFHPVSYNLFEMPLWVDKAVEKVKQIILLDLEFKVLEEQIKRLAQELRTTTQRVNLFEKVKIPEARENIKKIGVYLGDQQTAAVVRGKMSKKKMVKAG